MTAKCRKCGDTGDTGSGHLDCTRCGAAAERAELNAWASKILPYAGDAFDWMIYQRGKEAGRKEVAEK